MFRGHTPIAKTLATLEAAFEKFEGGKKWGRGRFRRESNGCMCSAGAIVCAIDPTADLPMGLFGFDEDLYRDCMYDLALFGFDAPKSRGGEIFHSQVYARNDAAKSFAEIHAMWTRAMNAMRRSIETPAVQS